MPEAGEEGSQQEAAHFLAADFCSGGELCRAGGAEFLEGAQPDEDGKGAGETESPAGAGKGVLDGILEVILGAGEPVFPDGAGKGGIGGEGGEIDVFPSAEVMGQFCHGKITPAIAQIGREIAQDICELEGFAEIAPPVEHGMDARLAPAREKVGA